MADDTLKVTSYRVQDDARPLPDGTVRLITRVRFFIGTHGPFEREFDRGVDPREIERAITTQKEQLARLGTL